MWKLRKINSLESELINTTCRTCTLPLQNKKDGYIISIFDGTSGCEADDKSGKLNIAKELGLLNVQVRKNDGLPQVICRMCCDILDNVRDFRNLAQKSQITLRKQFHQYIQSSEEILDIKQESNYNIDDKSEDGNREDVGDFQLNLDGYDHEMSNDSEIDLKVLEPSDENNVNGNSYKCWYCYESFVVLTELLDHEREHDEEKYHYCLCCDKSYKTSYNLKLHMKYHKNDPRTVQCEFCGKIFNSMTGLKNHKNISHLINPIQISIKRKSKAYPREYKCPVCSQCFVIPQALEKHIKLHDKSRKHRCNVCGLAYTRGDHLKRHINTAHEKKKLYTCEYCEEGFLDDATKLAHVRRRHFNSNIKCGECEKVFTNLENLRAHKLKHKTDLNYPCKVCDEAFPTGRLLADHQKKKHTKEQHEEAHRNFLEDVLKKHDIDL